MTRPLDRLPRPLDPFRSFKVKVALLVGISLACATTVFYFGSNLHFEYGLAAALVVALAVTQLLAHGMTSPLRQMTAAARAMARGDYDVPVRTTSRDEIGELAVAFTQMAADLKEADRRRRELIGHVSHELRTPITALQGVLENIVDGVADPDPQTLATALAQTQRLGALVAELLDLSRLDGGAVPLARESFEVAPFLAGAVAQARLTAGRGIRTTVEVPAGLTAYADPARLHQVVANLLDNAHRHSPTGGEVVVRAGADPDGALLLEVVDQGPGIRADRRTEVFDRFTRGGSGDRGGVSDGGTGLGLAISRWAVELHGGTIAVVGDPPGCRIRVVLPPG